MFILKVFQRDLNKGSYDVKRVLEYGNDLIKLRENVRGAAVIKSQLESVNLRWEGITKTTSTRQSLLENALGNKYQEEIKRITIWINQKRHEIEKVGRKKETPKEFPKYIQVWARWYHFF